MNDLVKTIIAILLTAILSPIVTITALTTKIEVLETSNAKIEQKFDKFAEKFGDRLRDVEMKQAAQSNYLAANH